MFTPQEMFSAFWVDCHRPFFQGKKIVVGITGSIAAFKAIDVIRGLKKCGAEVQAVVTPAGLKFVTEVTLAGLTGCPVVTSLWKSSAGSATQMNHIDLARWADLFVIIPATANSIAQLAQGRAPNVLMTEVLATRCPVVVCPAMNPAMWLHPATQANVTLLRSRGVTVLDAGTGTTACGDEGQGRLLEPWVIISELTQFFVMRSERPKKVLVSLGPTRSRLDPVRILTNRSSGKMGIAMVYALYKKGYDVTAVVGAVNGVQFPSEIRQISAPDTSLMAQVISEEIKQVDVFVSTAAVLDLEFSETFDRKLKKSHRIDVKFKPTVDILKSLGEQKLKSNKKFPLLVGFAAETEDFTNNARKKLIEKNLDAVFVNSVAGSDSGFEVDTNAGAWITPTTQEDMPRAEKSIIAEQLVQRIGALGA